MGLDLTAVGLRTAPVTHRYDERDVILYALGVGATRDEELAFLYEKHGPKVLPTFAVIPSFAVTEELFARSGGNYEGLVHLRQDLRLHAPIPPKGTLSTVGTITGAYDMKRFAQATFRTETFDEAGTLLATNDWGALFRFDGGFGGERPPAEVRNKVPEGPATFVHTQATSPEQALLYRLAGDLNALHADPELARQVGFEQPILHGLATFGYVGRAVLRHACGGDPARLRALGGQFRKPVTPGQTLVISGWRGESGYVVRAATSDVPDEFVFTNGYAEVA